MSEVEQCYSRCHANVVRACPTPGGDQVVYVPVTKARQPTVCKITERKNLNYDI